MLDVMDVGCPILRTPFFEQTITLLGYYGHGVVGGTIGLALLAHGYIYDNPRNRRAGMALLIALITVGVLVEILKNFIQLPRPKLRSSYGFPSGHTSAAFSLAATLTVIFPPLGPLWFLLAVLTGISRLYLRAHYTYDVIGGMLLGLAIGFPVAKAMIASAGEVHRGLFHLLGWLGAAALAVVGWGFFHSGERNIAAHMITEDSGPRNAPIAALDFGTAQSRPLLRYGWWDDETWEQGKRTVVWAGGLASEIVLSLPAAQDYRFRLNVFPYSPKGPACQRVEVRINNTSVTRLFLEQGWHIYEFSVPKAEVIAGTNTLRFYFDYAEPPKLRGRNRDERPLSVAFDSLQAFAAN